MQNIKRREWREPMPKWVRRCEHSPHRFQVRVYVGPKRIVCSVNFGSYPSVHSADRIGKMVRERMAKGVDIWTILTELIAIGEVSPNISSRWVYPTESGWAVKARSKGVCVHLPGPFQTIQEASRAAHLRLRANPCPPPL